MMKGLILLTIVSGVLCGVRRQGGCDFITCDKVLEPVCGTDGATYHNVCFLKVAACKGASTGNSLGLDYMGECTGKESTDAPTRAPAVNSICPTSCDNTEKYPICGTDGNTYLNKCFFMQAQCKMTANGQKLDVASIGSCSATATNVGVALANTGPVLTNSDPCVEAKRCDPAGSVVICGSDGVTYASKCEFLVAQCRASLSGQRLTIANEGRCDANIRPAISTNTLTSADKCSMNCNTDDKYPICGTDRQTYVNKCYFYEAKCHADAAGTTLDLAHVGECRTAPSLTADVCEPVRCDTTAERICGSDGSHYGNNCEFQRAVCKYALSGYRLTQVRCDAALSAVG